MKLRKILPIIAVSTISLSGCTVPALYAINSSISYIKKGLGYIEKANKNKIEEEEKLAFLNKSLNCKKVNFNQLLSKYHLLTDNTKLDEEMLALDLGVLYKDIQLGEVQRKEDLDKYIIAKTGLDRCTANLGIELIKNTTSFRFFAKINQPTITFSGLETLLAHSIRDKNVVLANKDK